MTKAYLISSGDYSDYGVSFVTLDPEVAQQYCDAQSERYREYRVEERELLRGPLGDQITVYGAHVTVWDPKKVEYPHVKPFEEKGFAFEVTHALAEVSHEPYAVKKNASGTNEGEWEIFFSIRGINENVVKGYTDAMISSFQSDFAGHVDRLTGRL